MLAQDIVLKHTTASLLHPSVASGKAFWNELDAIAAGAKVLESCFRVWIVPGDATVSERSQDSRGHVTIDKLGLKVLCDTDYATLQRFRARESKSTFNYDVPEIDGRVLNLFKTLIVPEIKRAVSASPRFGLLRQILFVLVISKWITESQLGPMLKQAGFLGSNNPDRYHLNVVGDEILNSMKQMYLQMFGDGVWHSTRTQVNMDTGIIEKRLYVAGAIECDDAALGLRRLNPITAAAARREATDGRRVGTTAISALPSFTASSTHN